MALQPRKRPASCVCRMSWCLTVWLRVLGWSTAAGIWFTKEESATGIKIQLGRQVLHVFSVWLLFGCTGWNISHQTLTHITQLMLPPTFLLLKPSERDTSDTVDAKI